MQKVDNKIEEGNDNECLLARSKAVRSRVEVQYQKREFYWKQLFQSCFASQMDKNTKFFHSIAKSKKQNKIIEEIYINGKCFRGVDRVKKEVQRFYKKLYDEEQRFNIQFDESLKNTISEIEVKQFETITTNEEIRAELSCRFGWI